MKATKSMSGNGSGNVVHDRLPDDLIIGNKVPLITDILSGAGWNVLLQYGCKCECESLSQAKLNEMEAKLKSKEAVIYESEGVAAKAARDRQGNFVFRFDKDRWAALTTSAEVLQACFLVVQGMCMTAG